MASNNHYTPTGWLVWGICALFFLYEFLLRTVIGTFQQPIMYDLQLSTVQYSLLSSTFYFLVYGLMQIPVGLLVDNFGLKKSLLFGAITCTVSAIGFSYANNYPTAIAFRMLMGMGSAFGFICLLVSVYDWMPRKHIALLIGISQFVGTLGPMLAAGPLSTFSTKANINWQTVYLILGCIGIIISLLILLFVKNNQDKTGEFTILHRPESFKSRFTHLFLKTQPWLIAVYSACVYCSLEYLSENEGKHFVALKGFDSTFASYLISIGWIGYAIGCPLLGWFSDCLQQRKSVMLFAALLGLSAMLMIIFSCSANHLIIAFFMLGIGTGGQSIGFATIAEQVKKKYLALGLSLNNAMITTFAAINAPMLGLAIEKIAADSQIAHIHYQWAFIGLVFIFSMAVLLALGIIQETFCKSQVEFTVLGSRHR